ncbi:hypothetical protein [Sandaracinus amylolyticus]|nr:hypothetical protein [Sandaracinus amylolyticus]
MQTRRAWEAVALTWIFACAACDGPHEQVDAGLDASHAPDGGSDAWVAPDAWVPVDPRCDDLDPCTRDALVGDACVSTPAPDGTLCDDGDGCTLGDRCQSGVCNAGERATADAALLSSASAPFPGPGLGIGADELLFFQPEGSGTRVRLVHVVEDGLFEVVDELMLEIAVGTSWWLGEGLVVYAGGTHVGLLEVRADELVARGTFELEGDVTGVRHAAALGDALLLCSLDLYLEPSILHVVDASDRDVPVVQSEGLVGHGDDCAALAASTDRSRAFLAGRFRTFVLAPDGTIERTLEIPSESVHVGAGYVTLATTRGVRLLRESDLVEVARLDLPVIAARHTRRGLEVVANRARGPAERVFLVFAVHPGAADPLELLSDEVLGPERIVSAAAPWASHDDSMYDDLRLFRIRSSAPYLDEIGEPHRFWPGWMRASGTTLHLRDDAAAVALDASDPTAPRAVAGGAHEGTPGGLTVEVPSEGPIGLYGARSASGSVPGSIETHGWWLRADVIGRSFDAEERPTDLATHRLPGLVVQVDATYRNVYAVRLHTARTRLDVLRWTAEQFLHPQELVAGLEQHVEAPAGRVVSVISRVHDDHAVAFATTDESDQLAAVHWVELGGSERVVGPAQLDVGVQALAVRGDRIVVLGWHPSPDATGATSTTADIVLITLERRGDELVEVSRVSWATPPTPRLDASAPVALLRFDGQVVYAQLPFGAPDAPGPAIVAMRAGDLSQRFVYPLPDARPIWSASDSDVGLAFSGPARVHVVRPWCP